MINIMSGREKNEKDNSAGASNSTCRTWICINRFSDDTTLGHLHWHHHHHDVQLPNGGLNPQAIFPIGSLTSLLVETDDDLNAALRDAIALARRLTFSPRGRFVSNISLQLPATPTVPHRRSASPAPT